MEKEAIKAKLNKIKALAEQGVGGEREGALALYKSLLEKYEITESELEEVKLYRKWFRYIDETDRKLTIQIFYKVTGSRSYFVKVDKRRRLVGIDCTDFEYDQIIFYYTFYKMHFQSQLDIFISAFFCANDLFPDDNARIHEEDTDSNKEASQLDLEKAAKIFAMASGIDKKTPNLQIGTNKEDENN